MPPCGRGSDLSNPCEHQHAHKLLKLESVLELPRFRVSAQLWPRSSLRYVACVRWESSERVDMSQKGVGGQPRRSARQSGKERDKADSDAQVDQPVDDLASAEKSTVSVGDSEEEASLRMEAAVRIPPRVRTNAR